MKYELLKIGLIIGIFIFSITINIDSSKGLTVEEKTNLLAVQGNTIIVDDEGDAEYKHIQDAINKALPGDIVEVYSGVYKEHIVMNKPIILKGISSEYDNGYDVGKPVINGLHFGDVVVIESEDCVVTGFNIVNSGRSFIMNSGIRVNADNCKIFGNTLQNTSIGISSSNSHSCVITDNIVLYNIFGIYVDNPINCTICNNTVFNSGLIILATTNQMLTNTITNNIINNKLLFIYFNQHNITISNPCAGQLIIIDCQNIIIENLNIQNTSIGLIIQNSSNIMIRNSFFENIHRGGISVQGNNCEIYHNMFRNCSYGCYIEGGDDFYIHHNNFIDVCKHDQPVFSWIKKHQTFMKSTNVLFDQNYWDDWIGLMMPRIQGMPKIIPGYTTYAHKVFNLFPVFEFDWNPSQQPYDI